MLYKVPPNEGALKKQTLNFFVFILPTSTLGPQLAHFLFTHKEIDYIAGTLAQF